MTIPQRAMDAAKLRLRLQMNARLRLEVIAAISRVFREYRDPVTDELLAGLVLAVPEELVGEAFGADRSDMKMDGNSERAKASELQAKLVPMAAQNKPVPPAPRIPNPGPHPHPPHKHQGRMARPPRAKGRALR